MRVSQLYFYLLKFKNPCSKKIISFENTIEKSTFQKQEVVGFHLIYPLNLLLFQPSLQVMNTRKK